MTSTVGTGVTTISQKNAEEGTILTLASQIKTTYLRLTTQVGAGFLRKKFLLPKRKILQFRPPQRRQSQLLPLTVRLQVKQETAQQSAPRRRNKLEAAPSQLNHKKIKNMGHHKNQRYNRLTT